MPKTKTYAKLLESQGYFEEALQVYKELIKREPKDSDIFDTIKKYENVNLKLLEYFVRMEEIEEYEKFERWLCKWS